MTSRNRINALGTRLLAVFIALLGSAALARELPVSAPPLVGMSDERLERISSSIEDSVENERVAGAVALILRNGEIAYFEAFGHADVDDGEVMQTDTLFRIASMTKPITSVAVLQLFERGHFQLDDPVSRYLPEFDRDVQVAVATDDGFVYESAARPVTIRHLLTHTSGISYRFMNVEPLYEHYVEAAVSDGLGHGQPLLAQNSERIATMPLASHPGELWTYGLSTDVLGRLVEAVSGQPLDEYFTEHIFLPLGMLDSHFRVPGTKHDRIASVYRFDDSGQLKEIEDGPVEDGPVTFAVDYPYSAGTRYLSGGAGITSTAEDYARFAQMLLNGGSLHGSRVLGRKTVELMISDHTGHLADSGFGADGFGLGVSIDGGPSASGSIRTRGSYGWGGFFNTTFWVDPEEQLVAVLLTQHYPFGVELLNLYPTLVYQAIDD